MSIQQAGGFTVWLTGMSGSGKTTLAKYLAQRFQALGRACEVLEGEEVTNLFGLGLQETKEDRNLLVRRLGYVARNISKANGVALVPALSPYREQREKVRRDIGRFVEVFIDCPVDTLISRDNTGRYKKALSGELPNFVGITDPYEPPSNPEVLIRSDQEAVADAAQKIFQSLLDLGFLTGEEVKLMAGRKLAKQPLRKKGKGESRAAKPAPHGARKARPATRAAKTVKAKRG